MSVFTLTPLALTHGVLHLFTRLFEDCCYIVCPTSSEQSLEDSLDETLDEQFIHETIQNDRPMIGR